jgi:mannose-6-phosphate isomerase-like protein (cupin superfamily)
MAPISIDNAEQYIWGDNCRGWHLLRQEGMSIIQERVPSGGSEILHIHEHARQFFFVLEGECSIVLGGEVVVLKKHQGIGVEPGIPHQFRNDSDDAVVFLVVSVPPSHGDRVNV